jgi:hypothetical protein
VNDETRDLYAWVMGEGLGDDLRREVEVRGGDLTEAQRDDIAVTLKARLVALLMTKIANATPAERAALNNRVHQLDNPFIDWTELTTALSEDELHGKGV